MCLAATQTGRTNVALDAPAYHNSLFADVDHAFHQAREVLLDKWPTIRPLYTNMGRLDTAETPPIPTPAPDPALELNNLRERLHASEERLAEVLDSRTWRLGKAAGRLLRRG